jgi:hypothetical protein
VLACLCVRVRGRSMATHTVAPQRSAPAADGSAPTKSAVAAAAAAAEVAVLALVPPADNHGGLGTSMHHNMLSSIVARRARFMVYLLRHNTRCVNP